MDLHRFWRTAQADNAAVCQWKYCYRFRRLLFRAETGKYEARLWISKPVAWMWNQNSKGKFYPLAESVHICVPAFFATQMPVTTEWPAEWDMFFRGSIAKIRACQEKRNAAWDGAGTAFRQNGKNTHGWDKFSGSPKSRKTLWGEEEQRNEWVFVLARKRMICSLRRRSRIP